MRWLVAGAGAIGSVVGGLLAEQGEEVWLLGRPAHVEAVRRGGLAIRGILGEHHVTSCRVASAWEELPREGWDVALVTVKSYDTPAMAEALAGRISPGALVVSLQNGLGNWEALAQRIPARQLVGGRVIFGAELPAPGSASVTVWGGDILLGLVDPARPGERIEKVARRFTKAGLRSSVTPRIREELWGKVIYNCALNPLSTLLEVPYGRLLERQEIRRMMEAVIEEAYAVAEKERIRLEPPTAAGYRRLLFERLIPATAAHFPSMLQDIRKGRRTEIDALNGAVVARGSRHGLPAPANRFLADFISALEGFHVRIAPKS